MTGGTEMARNNKGPRSVLRSYPILCVPSAIEYREFGEMNLQTVSQVIVDGANADFGAQLPSEICIPKWYILDRGDGRSSCVPLLSNFVSAQSGDNRQWVRNLWGSYSIDLPSGMGEAVLLKR